MSTSLEVARLLALNTRTLQRLVMKIIKEGGQASMRRDKIVKAIAKEQGAKHLSGSPREQFTKNVNSAIGAILRRSKPPLVKRGTGGDRLSLAKRKPNSHLSGLSLLLNAVRDRVVAIRFRCSSCPKELEVSDFDENGWCSDCGASYR